MLLDVLGKAKNMDTRTTIYKKADDIVYSLKMKASRAFFSEAVQKFGTMPFTLRAFEDEKKARMGIIECEKHSLMQPYQVGFSKNTVVSPGNMGEGIPSQIGKFSNK